MKTNLESLSKSLNSRNVSIRNTNQTTILIKSSEQIFESLGLNANRIKSYSTLTIQDQ